MNNKRPRRKYTEEHISFLSSIYNNNTEYSIEDCVILFNNKFETKINYNGVRHLIDSCNLHRTFKMIKGRKQENKTPEDQIEWLRKNYPIYTRKELTVLFNQTFNTNKTENAIKSLLGDHGIKCGRDTRFKPGNIPHSQGKHPQDWMSEEGYKNYLNTLITKENRLDTKYDNRAPIGTECIGCVNKKDPLGYVIVKIDTPTGYSKSHPYWKLKHHLIWEQHYGPVPKGHKIIFKDGNRFNFDINNLACIPNSVHLKMNQNKYYNHAPEITEAGIAVCESEIACYKLKKEGK